MLKFNSRTQLFWLCQYSGWLVYAILTELMIKLPGNEPWQIHFPHLLMDTLFGFTITLLLRQLFHFLQNTPTRINITAHIICIIIACLVWTKLKWFTLLWLYDNPTQSMTWFDFGTWNLASLTMLSTWSGFYYATKAYLKGVEEQRKAAEAINLASESQLKMLRYQLNPHFMFNSINAICTLILQKDNLHAVSMLEKLCDLLRYSLYTDPLAKVTVKEEIRILSTYCDIEKCRFKEKLTVNIVTAPELEQCLVPSLILQPLVENSIKHGMGLEQESYQIEVYFKSVADKLIIQVYDSGIGFEQNLTESDFGIGLTNCENRLKLIYPQNYQFKLDNSSQGGALITILIPKQTETESFSQA
ncbi:histidine kinase [Catenovulum sp. 2E275]|uniref:sensor histidine kinase n=1 Tax=Catenovulum sp. 2E275 TaxID=2980497 RepID=UPI0021D3065B|nr:histidine kinase [Catenovulum sp. 2E275]MCU4674052.1 histidine kinase [Catenovulum sp. 2E275]